MKLNFCIKKVNGMVVWLQNLDIKRQKTDSLAKLCVESLKKTKKDARPRNLWKQKRAALNTFGMSYTEIIGANV